jgi:hypothetical protein
MHVTSVSVVHLIDFLAAARHSLKVCCGNVTGESRAVVLESWKQLSPGESRVAVGENH